MKRFIFLGIALLFVTSLAAQVPGYMGKKITLEYRPDVGLNIPGFSTNHRYTLRNRLDVGYTIGRAMSLHLALDYNHIERYKITESELISSSVKLENNYYFQSNRFGIGAYLAFYRKSSFGLAPLGTYFAVGVYNLLPTTSRFRYFTSDTTVNSVVNRVKSTEMPDIYKAYTQAKMRGVWSVGITLGRRLIFAKRYLFDFGANYYTFLGTNFDRGGGTFFETMQKGEANDVFYNTYKFHSFLGFGIIL